MSARPPRLVLFCLAALALTSSSASAQELCREPNRFVLGASREAIAAMYPKAASAARIDGDVVLRCLKRGAGRLEKCAVKSESPAGYGFGEAALRIVSMQGESLNACGAAAKGVDYHRVEAPIRFRTPGGAAETAPDAKAAPVPATGAAPSI